VVVRGRRREDGRMPDPVTVWMVHLVGGSASDVEGTLRLEGDALVFEHAGKPAELRFRYGTIAKVKRVLSSPIMVVEWREDERAKRTAFYFVQPPPLQPPSPDELARSSERALGPLAQRRATSKRRHTRTNLGYLAISARGAKPIVREWTSELRTRIRYARA
jgi:hypothetical protein